MAMVPWHQVWIIFWAKHIRQGRIRSIAMVDIGDGNWNEDHCGYMLNDSTHFKLNKNHKSNKWMKQLFRFQK